MVVAHEVLTGVAMLTVAVIYGTDVFCAVVQRSAMARVADDVMVTTMGFVHLYGDKRLPIPGALGLLTTVTTAVTAVISGQGAAIAAGCVAVAALLVWFVIYGRVSAPVNRKLTSAAETGQTPEDARELQRTWDAVINMRSALQGIALASLYVGAVII